VQGVPNSVGTPLSVVQKESRNINKQQNYHFRCTQATIPLPKSTKNINNKVPKTKKIYHENIITLLTVLKIPFFPTFLTIIS